MVDATGRKRVGQGGQGRAEEVKQALTWGRLMIMDAKVNHETWKMRGHYSDIDFSSFGEGTASNRGPVVRYPEPAGT